MAALAAGQGPQARQGRQTFTGTVTDSECRHADHSLMKMGDTDRECALACVDAHGAVFVLYDGTQVYALSDQKASEAFAGRKAAVVGTLDADGTTIHVESISAP